MDNVFSFRKKAPWTTAPMVAKISAKTPVAWHGLGARMFVAPMWRTKMILGCSTRTNFRAKLKCQRASDHLLEGFATTQKPDFFQGFSPMG